MSYIIGSGWWSDVDEKYAQSEVNIFEFSKLWWKNIQEITNPEKIFIVDSNSPVKPAYWNEENIERISMLANWGGPKYGRNAPGKFEVRFAYGLNSMFHMDLIGCTRALYLQAFYALFNDVDHFVWVEQDCLLKGKNIIEKAIDNMGDADFSSNFLPDGSMESGLLVFNCKSILKIFNCFIIAKGISSEEKYASLSKTMNWKPFPFPGHRNITNIAEHEFIFKQKLLKEDIKYFVGETD